MITTGPRCSIPRFTAYPCHPSRCVHAYAAMHYTLRSTTDWRGACACLYIPLYRASALRITLAGWGQLSALQLHEEDELIWNDGVAPEAALDFDAPHVSKAAGLAWWLGGFGFFAAVYAFAKSTGQPQKKISADRDLPESTKTTSLGNYGKY